VCFPSANHCELHCLEFKKRNFVGNETDFGSANGGENHGGAGDGPWLMVDMENALWGADKGGVEEAIKHDFVVGIAKGDTGPAPGHFAIKGGDAQAGVLKTYYDGPRASGYAPMKKQGAIVLVQELHFGPLYVHICTST